jgi:hypothetical protein
VNFATGPFTPAINDGRHVFVFGSNLAGRHGKGAALQARLQWGAEQGVGLGVTGHTYALPTKDRDLKTLPLNYIEDEVKTFLCIARMNPHRTFLVTPVGTGLAGYTHDQIAPMFKNAPDNCVLPAEWKELL